MIIKNLEKVYPRYPEVHNVNDALSECSSYICEINVSLTNGILDAWDLLDMKVKSDFMFNIKQLFFTLKNKLQDNKSNPLSDSNNRKDLTITESEWKKLKKKSKIIKYPKYPANPDVNDVLSNCTFDIDKINTILTSRILDVWDSLDLENKSFFLYNTKRFFVILKNKFKDKKTIRLLDQN